MSSVILTNWTVYYSGDTGGDLQVRWTGTTGTSTLRQLYSALQNLFDNSTEMDDGTPMSAQTPTDYTIGLLDAGETNCWFIDPESIKHLTGGGLQTQSWARTDTNIGIVKVPRSGTNIVAGDVGHTIAHADLDSGTLLYVDGSYLWIRPASAADSNDWDSTSGNITCNSHIDSQTGGSTTGEMIWSNIYTLGTIESNTTLYVSQSNSIIDNSEVSGPGSWWAAGHMDILVLSTNQGTLTDRGLLTVYARQYSKKYNFYTINVSSGGRTPIPLSTSDDLNNTSGYRQISISETVAFVVDEVATGGTSGAVAIVTAYSATLMTYYLVGDLTEFNSSETITGSIAGNVSSTGAAENVPSGPATALSITFGLDTTLDVNDDSTYEDYSVVIDLTGSVALTTMNERLKYKTRRGETTTLDGIEGQQYIGIDYRVDYLALNGIIADGSTLTQTLADATTATTEVVAHEETDKYMMLRDTRGTLEYGAGASNLVLDGSNWVTMTDTATATVITPAQEHPFGVFAGGKFFGARGVAVKNVLATDAENYELIDNDGNRIVPPATYAITVTAQDSGGTAIEDAQVFIRKAGDYYSYTSHNTNNVAGNATFDVNETVDTDLPQTGWLHIWDADTNTKQNYRYASWTSKTFTLNTEETGSATSAGTPTVLNSTGISSLDIEEGDTIRNTSDSPDAWAIVDEIVSANQITTTPLQGGTTNEWQNGNNFSVHKLAITYFNTDLVDIPLLNGQTNASGIVSMSYSGSVPEAITVRIRSNEESTKYVPYNTSGTITSAGYSLTAVLTEDSVAV